MSKKDENPYQQLDLPISPNDDDGGRVVGSASDRKWILNSSDAADITDWEAGVDDNALKIRDSSYAKVFGHPPTDQL